MVEDEDLLVATRRSWHALAEHVLAAARHAATGRIGLAASTGGFATPPFDRPDGEAVVAVAGTDLVVRDGHGARRAPITTVGAAAALVGIAPGAPAEVYRPQTPLRPDEALVLDPGAAAVLAAALEVGDRALARVVADAAGEGRRAAPVTLWPEHLDVATTVEEVNLGVSPGDEALPRPYAYVGPWARRRGPFWDAPFGSLRPLDDLDGWEAVLAYFEEGRRRAAEDPLA